MTASGLIGRERPTGILEAAVGRTADSHGGLVLVAGEPGIGKTALVAAAADQARRMGALVLSGTCWDREDAPGYWPWVQVVRSLQRSVGSDEWARASAEAGDDVPLLLGELDSSGSWAADAGGFRIYDAAATLLVAASRSRPVVVALDDLHWADAASIRLLDFVVRHTWFERLLVLGTYRDVEVNSTDHPLRPLMLPLIVKATAVTLTGLDVDDVRVLMTRAAGREPDQEQVADVHRRTGGNPFFVQQLARLVDSGDAVAASAPGIRDVLDRRLGYLPEAVVGILTSAAVLGPEFHRQLLAASSARPVAEVDVLLDQAAAARLVVQLGAGRFRFAHDLVREALYGSLDAKEMRQRHASVVRAFQRSPELAERVLPAARAHHAHQGVPDVSPSDALDYLVAAARDASGRLASEEAAGHYRRALEVVSDDQAQKRAMIALDLGAEQQRAGELPSARQTFQTVVTVARELDDPELLARAALGLHGLGSRVGGWRLEADLLDEALDVLLDAGAAPDSPLAVRLLAAAGRARSRGAPPEPDAAQKLSARAVDLARGSGDDEALGMSLLARHDAVWEPGTAPERLALADEMTSVSRRVADRELELQASLLRMVALLEQGEPRALDEHASFVALAESLRLPRFRYLAVTRQGTMATLMGRFDEARAYIDDALALGEELGEVERRDLWRGQSFALETLRGRFDEVDALMDAYRADAEPRHLLIVEARLAAQNGDADLALQHLSEVPRLEEPLPRSFAPLWTTARAQAAAASRDPQLCESARAGIASLADRWAVTAAGSSVHGPMAHWIAVLDAAQKRWDAAIDGFAKAQQAADRLQARPWSIQARAGRAEALIGRGLTDDATVAIALLDEVERDATEIGMRPIIEQARNTRAGLAEPGGAEPDGADRAGVIEALSPSDIFRFDGQVWTLGFAGRTRHLPDAKGLHDLHVLLSRPGRDVPAVELLNPAGGQLLTASRRMGADTILDEQAKASYRQRITRLDEGIDRALARQDDRRAADLDRERDALIGELRRASGLAGRARRLGDESERARKTVTARIRHTLRRLGQSHPELAEHLQASVSTGTRCRYEPTDNVTWTL